MFDTHSNQKKKINQLLKEVRESVSRFIEIAKLCGFFDQTLIATYSDFGRRFEENSQLGTDHGWGTYFFLFGRNLKRRVFGYSETFGPDDNVRAAIPSSKLEDIIVRHSYVD